MMKTIALGILAMNALNIGYFALTGPLPVTLIMICIGSSCFFAGLGAATGMRAAR